MTEAEYKDQHPEYDEYESEICHDCSLCRHKKTDGIMIRCPFDESPRNPDCGFELIKPTLAQAVEEVEDICLEYEDKPQEEVDYVDACIDTLIEFAKRSIERKEADGWIPVSERLPKPPKPNDDIYNIHCSDFVLVCIEWWNGQKVIEIASYNFDDEEWDYHGSEESEVVAWRSLPKPYEESEDND